VKRLLFILSLLFGLAVTGQAAGNLTPPRNDTTIVSNAAITFTLTTSNFLNTIIINTAKQWGSNLVKVISGTNTYVSQTHTNGTNFYTVNADASAIATAINFRTNRYTTNVAGTPVVGPVWFQGAAPPWATNNARNTTWEWDPTNQSMTVGSLGNVGFDNHNYLPSSNYWDAPNIGLFSWRFGSNVLANARWAVAWGVKNLIYTNADNSFIGPGTNCAIRTNSYLSFIGSGNNCIIHVNSQGSFMGSGQDNAVAGGSPWSVVNGGFNNQITTANSYSVMGGGRDNTIAGNGTDGSKNSVLAGGEINVVRGTHSVIGGGSNNNMRASGGTGNTISGGQDHDIGVATTFFSSWCTISGGFDNDIDDNAHFSVIGGGRGNQINGSSTNSTIAGGYNNLIEANAPFGNILGGFDNYIDASGDYGTISGYSNQLSALGAHTIGHNATNQTPHSILIRTGPTNWFHVGPRGSTNQGRLMVGDTASGTYGRVGGTFYESGLSYTNLNGANTFSNLASRSIAGNTLSNAGDMVFAEWAGIMPAALENTNDLQINWGSQTVVRTGLQTASNTAWRAQCWITCGTSGTAQHAEGRIEWGPGGGVPFAFTNSNLELTQTNGIATVLALQSAARRVGAITNNSFRLEIKLASQ
jgi:hypothetical protein